MDLCFIGIVLIASEDEQLLEISISEATSTHMIQFQYGF